MGKSGNIRQTVQHFLGQCPAIQTLYRASKERSSCLANCPLWIRQGRCSGDPDWGGDRRKRCLRRRRRGRRQGLNRRRPRYGAGRSCGRRTDRWLTLRTGRLRRCPGLAQRCRWSRGNHHLGLRGSQGADRRVGPLGGRYCRVPARCVGSWCAGTRCEGRRFAAPAAAASATCGTLGSGVGRMQSRKFKRQCHPCQSKIEEPHLRRHQGRDNVRAVHRRVEINQEHQRQQQPKPGNLKRHARRSEHRHKQQDHATHLNDGNGRFGRGGGRNVLCSHAISQSGPVADVKPVLPGRPPLSSGGLIGRCQRPAHIPRKRAHRR
jgi:hypothetical protein